VLTLPRPACTDEELVHGLLEQRPAAVAELLHRHSDLVRGVLVRTLGSSHDVDDLCQETFLTVIRRCHTLRDPAALRSFVVSVAIRLAKNEARKRALRRFVGLDAAHELPCARPHDAAIAQGVRHLYAALNQLDANSRMAFFVRHVEGFDLNETAAACGCSLATVKRRLARAHRRFEAIARRDPVLRSFVAAEGGNE
jgi:RNA polymerase sigma-70 factor (ECF subfamily)